MKFSTTLPSFSNIIHHQPSFRGQDPFATENLSTEECILSLQRIIWSIVESHTTVDIYGWSRTGVYECVGKFSCDVIRPGNDYGMDQR